jgi:ParB-like chromosome segregation protein Spo0J
MTVSDAASEPWYRALNASKWKTLLATNLGWLKPYGRNARTHSRRQIKQIAASIKTFEFNNPVLITVDGEIIAGHGRYEAAKLLGKDKVPAIQLSHLSEADRWA